MEEVEVEVEVVVKQEMKQSNTTKRIILSSSKSSPSCLINNLDDGCLMHICSFLSPIPDRYNTALVCHRWLFLACHPRLWLRVERSIKDPLEPGVFPTIETAVAAARPGDTILISAGGRHLASDIQIKKPLCLCIGVPVNLQIGKLDSEDRDGLLFAPQKWKAHSRWVCASVRVQSPRLPIGPHCEYGKCTDCVVYISEML